MGKNPNNIQHEPTLILGLTLRSVPGRETTSQAKSQPDDSDTWSHSNQYAQAQTSKAKPQNQKFKPIARRYLSWHSTSIWKHIMKAKTTGPKLQVHCTTMLELTLYQHPKHNQGSNYIGQTTKPQDQTTNQNHKSIARRCSS